MYQVRHFSIFPTNPHPHSSFRYPKDYLLFIATLHASMMSPTILTDIVEELEDTSQDFRHRNVHHPSSTDPDPRNVQQFQRYRSHRTAQAPPSPGTRPTPPGRGSRSTSRDQHPPTIPHVGPTPTTAATVGSRSSANINRNSHDSRYCRLDSLPPHRQSFCIDNVTSSQRVRMSPTQHQQSTRHPNHRPGTTTMNTSSHFSGSPIHTSYQAHTLPAPKPRRGIRTAQ